MTLRNLEIFVAVCDTLNMTQAAKMLYTSQSAVSQSIAELEKTYGIRLFERLSKRLYLTDAGTKLLGYARHMLSVHQELERDLQALTEGGALRIGASVTVGAYVLPMLVKRFVDICPQVTTTVRETNTQQIELDILEDRLDLAIVEGDTASPDLVGLPLMQDKLVLICSPCHRFATMEAVQPELLSGEQFMVCEDGSGTRRTFETVMAANGLPWHAAWVCNTTDTIRLAVMQNLGVAVLSRLAVERDVREGKLHEVPIHGLRFARNFRLIYHENKFISKPMQQFMALCAGLQMPLKAVW